MRKSLKERGVSLRMRRADLLGRMAGVESELQSHQAGDWPDRAIEREADDVLERLGLSAQAELHLVNAALRRLQDGSYGQCARCGSDIGAARLDALPYTPYCRSCAGQIEARP